MPVFEPVEPDPEKGEAVVLAERVGKGVDAPLFVPVFPFPTTDPTVAQVEAQEDARPVSDDTSEYLTTLDANGMIGGEIFTTKREEKRTGMRVGRTKGGEWGGRQ